MSDKFYQISIERRAAKSLENIPHLDRKKNIDVIQNLSYNPRPFGYKKLTGREGFRLRVGNYRIIYEINHSLLNILIIDIGHRKDIYR